jgi:hypothetical protein
VWPELDQHRAKFAVRGGGDEVAGLGFSRGKDRVSGQVVAGRLAAEGVGVVGVGRVVSGFGFGGGVRTAAVWALPAVSAYLTLCGIATGAAGVVTAAIRSRTPWFSFE